MCSSACTPARQRTPAKRRSRCVETASCCQTANAVPDNERKVCAWLDVPFSLAPKISEKEGVVVARPEVRRVAEGNTPPLKACGPEASAFIIVLLKRSRDDICEELARPDCIVERDAETGAPRMERARAGIPGRGRAPSALVRRCFWQGVRHRLLSVVRSTKPVSLWLGNRRQNVWKKAVNHKYGHLRLNIQ